jgi:hypothetical protein
MAGNHNSGRKAAFLMTEKELTEKIQQYKTDLEKGKFGRASWPHFAAYLDSTEAELAEVMKIGKEVSNAYYGRAKALKKMATWMRGQYASASGWSAPAVSSKAMFALKQDVGDGVKWSDQENKQTGPVEVKISFGGNDPRAKNAAK